MPGVRRESLHEYVWPTFLHFGHQERRLPIVNLHFVHVDCADLGAHCKEFTLRAVVQTGRHFLRLELALNLYFMRFFDKVPFIKHTVLAGDNNCISEGSHCRTDYWSNE
jgi:hypothetical protein